MSANSGDIAVIGMACRFPGANSPAEFWDNLYQGRECITFFSEEELRTRVPDAMLRDPSYVRARGCLDDIETFDAEFFGINTREAQLMDPQQRIFMECVFAALEDAGCDPFTYPLRIGLFASASTNFYVLNQFAEFRAFVGSAGGIQAFIGGERDFLPTRLAYKLNLRGPAINVQTGCSSSLVGVHLACQSLLNYECDTAIAGGVCIAVPHKVGYRHDYGGISSPDGHCRAFDSEAQGSIGGSGAGAVMLKRLEDALEDRDCIRAVIKGSAINNDGASKVAYTAPGIKGQYQVILDALAVAGFSANDISYVEAHGTGTPLGDPIEVAALTQAFRQTTNRSGFCGLGSVKTNVGHLDAAAGVTGLIKTVLALQHGVIPPSLNFKTPNPELHLEGSPFFVPVTSVPWKPEGPRRAGVSSFGIGGTNAHVIVEEWLPAEASNPSLGPELLVLSARSREALTARVAQFKEYIANAEKLLGLPDTAYTLQSGRSAFTHRCFAVCNSSTSVSDIQFSEPVARNAKSQQQVEVAFLFPGQASQRVGMARGLYQFSPVFRQLVDECCARVRPFLGCDLRDILWPGEANRTAAAERIVSTEITQPIVFIIDYAIARLWLSLGVRPSMVIGHSLGEFVAACIAGVLDIEDALRLVVERGRLMSEVPRGTMFAIELPETEVIPLLGEKLSLAAVNGPDFSVIGGPSDACAELMQTLAKSKTRVHPLRTSHAFHSSMMDPILPRFAEVVDRVPLRAPSIRYISNLTGALITEQELSGGDYWVRHLRQTVRFSDGLTTLLNSNCSVLIEVGPGSILTGLVGQHPAYGEGRVAIQSLPYAEQPAQEAESLLRAIGTVWAAGVNINWKALGSGEKRRKIVLPTYPFVRRRYWIEAPAPTPAPAQTSSQTVPAGPAVRPTAQPVSGNGKSAFLHSLIQRQMQLLQEQIELLKDRA